MRGAPEPTLKRRTLKAGAWAGGSHVLGQVIRLAGNLVLTRFLLPEAFGLMAVISTLMLALNLVSDIGSGTVIVQSKRGTEPEFLQTAWTLQVIRGFSIWAVSLLACVGIAVAQSQGWFTQGTVYDDPRLPLLIGAATFSMVLLGFASVNGKLAERALQLRTVMLIEVAAQVASLGVMVLGAVYTGSVWSLVIGGLVSALLRTCLTHALLAGPRPRLRLEPAAVRELLGKGKWVIVSSLLGFLAMNGDRLLLGGLIDGTRLGFYSIAYGLASMAPAVIATLLAKVIFPAFSEVVRQRPEHLAGTYRRFQRLTDLVVGLLAGAMFMASDLVIGVLYDDRYRAAGPIFGILAIGSIGVRFLVVEQIYIAMGRMSLLAAAILPRVIILVVGLPIGHALAGLNGALAAIVLSQFAHWPMAIWFRMQNKLGGLRNDVVLPLAIAAGLVCGWLLNRLAAFIHG